MESSERARNETELRVNLVSATTAGAGAGVVMGWLNVVGFAWNFPDIFASLGTLFFWGGSVAFWYLVVAAASSAVLALCWTLYAKESFRTDFVAVRGVIACAVIFSIAWLWTALWLNFAVLGSPREVNGTKFAANGSVLLAFAAMFAAVISRRATMRRLGKTPRAVTMSVAAFAMLGFAGSFASFDAKRQDSSPPVALSVSGKIETDGAPNVVLLTIDTLRADHLGFYGHHRDTSPFLDELAEESIVFDNAYSAKTNTSPSVASFLTGEYPHSHGVHGTGQVLSDDAVTLAERLSAAGYATAGIITNGNLVDIYNFDQGFDEYLHGRTIADGLTTLATDWLDNSRKEPFFMWVHFIDPHSPYSPPSPYGERYVGDEYYAPGAPLPDPRPTLFDGSPEPPDGSDPTLGWYVAQYDGEIRFIDEQIRRLYDRLKTLGLLDNTLVVLTADHGECFGDDSYYGHGESPHDAGIRVPLLFRLPRRYLAESARARRPQAFAGGVDIVPTVLDIVGIAPDPAIDGRSLVSYFHDEDAGDSFVMIEAGTGPHIGPGFQQILRQSGWKYVRRDTDWARKVDSPLDILWLWNAAIEGGLEPDELYDMTADPHETDNLIYANPLRAERMRKMIAVELKRAGPRAPDAISRSKKELEKQRPDLVDELRELGYMD